MLKKASAFLCFHWVFYWWPPLAKDVKKSRNSTSLDFIPWPFSLNEPRPEYLLMSLFSVFLSMTLPAWRAHKRESELFFHMCFQCGSFCAWHLLSLLSMHLSRFGKASAIRKRCMVKLFLLTCGYCFSPAFHLEWGEWVAVSTAGHWCLCLGKQQY